eukprot:COSAG01_NODE_4290_length_5170_cov_2.814829_2_plen_163_part_00
MRSGGSRNPFSFIIDFFWAVLNGIFLLCVLPAAPHARPSSQLECACGACARVSANSPHCALRCSFQTIFDVRVPLSCLRACRGSNSVITRVCIRHCRTVPSSPRRAARLAAVTATIRAVAVAVAAARGGGPGSMGWTGCEDRVDPCRCEPDEAGKGIYSRVG